MSTAGVARVDVSAASWRCLVTFRAVCGWCCCLSVAFGCADPTEPDRSAATGGSTSSTSGGRGHGAGVSTGGSSTGGSSTGGSSTGGSSAGGNSTGGSSASGGGSASGGAASGGQPGSGGSGATGCASPPPGTSGDNPLFTDIFTADPSPMVHDCTFYISCGHDEGTNGFVMRDWYVLSSTDMVSWSYNGGPVLSLDDFDWADANAWAGHLMERDGSFYWYVPINEAGGSMTIGVAVADSPTGPFTDALGEPLVSDSIEMENWDLDDPGQTPHTIDPNVLVDDDGQAYLYYGSFWRVVGVPLNDDMISLGGQLQELTINGTSSGEGFWEAPFMIKREGTYYLVYAAGENPATIDYATSDDPMGPFEYAGRILDQLPNLPGEDAATSHPGVAEFAGQWYLTYHLSDGPGGGTYRRQVAVDKLFFNDDGSIQPVTPSDGLTF